MTEHFSTAAAMEAGSMRLRFFPSNFSLDNAVCELRGTPKIDPVVVVMRDDDRVRCSGTAYAPTNEPLDLHLICKTLQRTT